MHFSIEPLSIIGVSVAEVEQSSTLLLPLLPAPSIEGTVVVLHGALSMSVVVPPLARVAVSVFVLVCTTTMLLVSQPVAFIPLAIRV